MSQTYTDDCFDSAHVGLTDLTNIEANFMALKSAFSGASAPANTVGGMWWLDTTTHILKVRNEANSAWISVLDMATGRAVDAGACGGITITAGAGLTGGGALSASRTLAIADGGVTPAKLASYAAGDNVLYYSTDGYMTSSTTLVLGLSVQIDRPGTLRIVYTKAGSLGYSQVYRSRSGTATAVGTLHYDSGTVEYSEDISGWQAGDLIQVYARVTSTSLSMQVSKLKIKSNEYGIVAIS